MPGSEYISILKESLEKKVEILEKIREMNRKQKAILTDENSAPDDLQENIDSKGDLVDEILALDDGFETVYSKVGDEINSNRSAYRDDIIEMQELITKITDLSAAIESEEQENRLLAEQRFSYVRQQVQKVRKSQKAVNDYYHMMMKTNYESPQFYDNKK